MGDDVSLLPGGFKIIFCILALILQNVDYSIIVDSEGGGEWTSLSTYNV
jgi:hypothetical protein